MCAILSVILHNIFPDIAHNIIEHIDQNCTEYCSSYCSILHAILCTILTMILYILYILHEFLDIVHIANIVQYCSILHIKMHRSGLQMRRSRWLAAQCGGPACLLRWRSTSGPALPANASRPTTFCQPASSSHCRCRHAGEVALASTSLSSLRPGRATTLCRCTLTC